MTGSYGRGLERAPETRLATVADVPQLVEVLARAFDDDPVACFLFRGDERRRRGLRRFFDVQLRHMYLHEGEVWTTPDLAGAALWGRPGKRLAGWRDLWHLAPLLRELLALGPALADAGRLFATVDRMRPKTEHWYLATLGTDPPRQGHGVGSALLERVCRRLDDEGLPAYLESSKERNVAFYARHRFDVVGEYQVPQGPHLWFMWRPPHPSG
jgi:GNAT superfamily N-acetyltransferase